MGWLDDMKRDMAEARDARDTISPVPAQRIDTVVLDPVSGEQRHRTDYAGTLWANFENATGGTRGDTLIGNDQPNRLVGGGGRGDSLRKDGGRRHPRHR